ADAALGEQLRELLGVDEVTLDRVLQVGLPVQLDRAGDVAGAVGAGVLVDLDVDGVRRVEIALGPVNGDQDVGACHGMDPFGVRQVETGVRRRRATNGYSWQPRQIPKAALRKAAN